MKRLIVLGAALAFVGGCSDDDSAPSGDMGEGRCRARLAPGVLSYELTGDLLTLSRPEEQADLVVTREGDGSGLFDTWLADEDGDGVIAQRALLVFEEDRATFQYECYVDGDLLGVAEASSPAVYTDDTIEILQADESIVYY